MVLCVPAAGSEEHMTDLLGLLSQQIKGSDWLKENTVESLEHENPELIAEWKRAMAQQTGSGARNVDNDSRD